MDIVDTHCHIHEAANSPLNDATHHKWAKAGKTDPDQIIADAAESGVTKLICVGTDVDDSILAVEFVQDRPNTWASIGIHPHEAKRYVADQAALKRFESLAEQPGAKVVAVGECGLDYFYNHSPKAEQEQMLRFQIELALRHNLPMIFHVREAFGDFWPIFDSYAREGNKIRGVVHSFSATQRELDAILERGLFVGLNGIVTFTKDSAQIAAFQSVPAAKMLIETDAPYLTPTPYRGSICESKHATTTLRFVANMQGVEERYLAIQTTENARQLFNLV
jgi:TatD DNase family protein